MHLFKFQYDKNIIWPIGQQLYAKDFQTSYGSVNGNQRNYATNDYLLDENIRPNKLSYILKLALQ